MRIPRSLRPRAHAAQEADRCSPSRSFGIAAAQDRWQARWTRDRQLTTCWGAHHETAVRAYLADPRSSAGNLTRYGWAGGDDITTLVAGRCPRLEEVTLGAVTAEGLEAVAALPEVRSLSILGHDGGPLAPLVRMQRLERLSVALYVGSFDLAPLTSLPNLRVLLLDGRCGDAEAALLAPLGQLRSLTLIGNQAGKPRLSSVGASALSQMGRLTHLTYDAAWGAPLPVELFAGSSLQSLTLRGHTFRRGGVDALRQLTGLKHLDVEHCQFDPEDLRELVAHLEAAGVRVTA
ncbi:MAG TPA: hypothetical protein VFH51_03165 [Myxococcota bacterium]|nr:hypothetical protein [Myxococcota bacterium]